MKSWKKENVLKHIVTSLSGLALIATGIIMILRDSEPAVIAQATPLILLGLYLLGVKDPKMPGSPGARTLLIVICIALSGCVTYKKCIDKYGTGKTYTITVHDTIPYEVKVPVAGDAVSGTVNLDSICQGLKDSAYAASESGRLAIAIWADKYNRLLHFKSSLKPDTIRIIDTIYREIKQDCPQTAILDPTKEVPGPLHRFLRNVYDHLSVWALLGGIVVVAIVLLLVSGRTNSTWEP